MYICKKWYPTDFLGQKGLIRKNDDPTGSGPQFNTVNYSNCGTQWNYNVSHNEYTIKNSNKTKYVTLLKFGCKQQYVPDILYLYKYCRLRIPLVNKGLF
jgi:hypothetical protein